MRRGVRSRCLACAALAVIVAATEAGAGDRLAEEDAAVLAWLDKTDLPSGVGKPWVHVTTGRFGDPFAEPNRDAPKVAEVIEGFLLEETPEAFIVLSRNALPEVVAKAMRGGGPHAAAAPTATAANFEDDARSFIAALAAGRTRPCVPWPVGPRAEAAILARAARDAMLPALAHDLLEAARVIRTDPAHAALTFAETIAGDLETPVFGRIIADFGRPEVTRTALLDRLQTFLEAFPASTHAERARATHAILVKMVQEDDEYVKASKPFDSLSRDEQIGALIFRLRDVNGGQWGSLGSPTIWRDEWLNESGNETPAARLVALGFAAVPALIPALEDVRWTRTVGFSRRSPHSYYVLTVGDATREVLERIAGRSFWKSTRASASMAKDGQAADVRREVEAWWKGIHD